MLWRYCKMAGFLLLPMALCFVDPLLLSLVLASGVGIDVLYT